MTEPTKKRRVPIAAQAVAVELAYLAKRGHRDVIRGLAIKGKRPMHELEQIERELADLRPAVATMKFLVANEEAFKTLLGVES